MTEFNTSLLREKFTIRDALPSDMTDKRPVIAMSNRLVLPFTSNEGEVHEEYVVRAQNMHTCARLGAQMCRHFQEKGPLMAHRKPFDWKYAYLAITKGYEKKWNPHRWVAVYRNGKLLFEDGETHRHPFLDIIEQCDARNKEEYENSLQVAENAFKKAGKLVTIEHDANVALVLNISDEEARSGVILRGPNQTTTFSFTAHKKAGRMPLPSHCLSASAAFLEGIQLAFFVGMAQEKLKYELIDSDSDEAKKSRESGEKIGRLNAAVQQFENMFDVTFRPDRPNMPEMIDEAKAFARKILGNEIKKKILAGDSDAGDWVL